MNVGHVDKTIISGMGLPWLEIRLCGKVSNAFSVK